MVIQGVSYLSDFEAKKAIIAAAAKLYARGWMIAGDGSLSVRVGPNAVWITVEGADKAALTQDQLVRIDLNGKQAATNRPKPLGNDLEAHLRVYKENERVRSIVHAYPICTVYLSANKTGAEAAAYTPAVRKLGRISMVEPLKTEQAISDVSLLSKNDNGVIIEGDGCMMWGKTPMEAADYIETLDYYCQAAKCLSESQPQAYTARAHVQTIVQEKPVQHCTGNCTVCQNSGCTERRNEAEPAATAPKAVCSGSCDNCGRTDCTERIVHQSCSVPAVNAAPASPAYTASIPLVPDVPVMDNVALPAGMTGLIRPGEPLPPLPEEKPVAAAKPAAAPIKPGVFASGMINAGPHEPKNNDTAGRITIDKSSLMSAVVRGTLGG